MARTRSARSAAPAAAPVVTPEEAIVLLQKQVAARDAQIAALSAKLEDLTALHTYDAKEPFAEARRLYDHHLGLEQAQRPLMAALASLAAYFYEEGQVPSADKRNWETGNTIAMQQKFFLRDICYKLTDKWHYASDRLQKAADEWRRVDREHLDDEIGKEARRTAIYWGKKARLEFDRVDNFLQQAEAFFEEVTGDRFVRQEKKAPVKAAPRTRDEWDTSDIEKEAAALGWKREEKRPYSPTHDGVNAPQ